MPRPVLLIDNYDSFVFNLERYVRELGGEGLVFRNDSISLGQMRALDPAAIILSPGPRTPKEAGISEQVVREFGPDTPILGVCLGHQAIASALGGRVVRAPEPVHGRTSLVHHQGQGLFAGCEQPLRATRYHSLLVEESTLPESLSVTARTPEGIIMGLKHRAWPTFGLQFHPESILTRCGHRLLANFLQLAHTLHPTPPLAGEMAIPEGNDDFFGRQIGEDALRPA